jgi:hypothetical protein
MLTEVSAGGTYFPTLIPIHGTPSHTENVFDTRWRAG